ncbi:uncharacterized protein LODBEIA_P57840 [Lodderomyces beijingensis]|uniref:Endopolyphosphatase n=1 Tax=Lodderomyces beijingensis TaxID=1775926 RepID=A0ABP0ZTV0_9ASCO
MDEKSCCNQARNGQNLACLKRISLVLVTVSILLLVGTQRFNFSLFFSSSLNQPSTSTFARCESIELTASQKDELTRLGLTPKKPVKFVSPEKGEQIIYGRFLHITDIHPDPYFKIGSSFEDACHSSKGDANKFGDAISGCDSPMLLMNETISWIKTNLKDKIDFIVWTGDNVRHDNDRNFPRTEQNIFEMNEHVSQLLYETFKKEDTPELAIDLVPSLGNNDVFPHNLFSLGPTLQTRELFRIWQRFIPQSQLHIFNRGAYFFKEVIPGQLAVLSINTLYWFQSNPLVDNCDKRKEPGYKLFEWLGYVFKELRARKMKVWLSGHVPPNEKNYDATCLRKYVVWAYEYRDIIIGGLYGHMNIDHFIPLDSVAAYKSINKDKKKKKEKKKSKSKAVSLIDNDGGDDSDDDDDDTEPLGETSLFRALDANFDDSFFRVQGGVPENKVKYMDTLREELYAAVKGKKKSKAYGERYVIAHVSSSIVPTFNPGIRVWEYNITNLAHELPSVKFEPWDKFFFEIESLIERQSKYTDDEEEEDKEEEDANSQAWIFKKKKTPDKTFPLPMPKNAKLGPAYIPQSYTPERYVNYYLDLEAINKGDKPFDYEIEYSTDDKTYGMPVLTVEEWLKMARLLGKPFDKSSNTNGKQGAGDKRKHTKKKKNKNGKEDKKLEELWQVFLRDAFVSSGYEHKGLG